MDLQRDVSLTAAVERLRTKRLGIEHFISIGAGSGGDSMYIREKLCPGSSLLLLEAQSSHGDALAEACRTRPNSSFLICAVTEKDGDASFLASAPKGGVVSAVSDDVQVLPGRSIDSLIAERDWKGPVFLKFDTHGSELEIFAGAEATLAQTALIMIEVYNFKLNFVDGKNLVFYEMCAWLGARGFRTIDMCDPLYRPNDSVLWQMQLFFVRDDHPAFKSNSYSAPALA